MSDDLDDLFGAIDGGDVDDNAKDVKANDQEQIEEKGEQVNNVEERSKRSKLDNENMGNDDNENDKTRTNNVNYTNIMSMSSTITKPKEDEPMKNKYNSHDNNEKKQDEASTPKEISTGTSHDKSVRSYSAYPKNYEKPKPDNANHDNSSSLPAAKTYPFTLDPFQQQAVNFPKV